MITNRVEALRMGTERLKDSIEKPFEQIMARTATLARLQVIGLCSRVCVSADKWHLDLLNP